MPVLRVTIDHNLTQVEDNCKGPSLKVAGKNHCVVIADEKDYNICIPFLEQGRHSASHFVPVCYTPPTSV